jgi:hypothetical protein
MLRFNLRKQRTVLISKGVAALISEGVYTSFCLAALFLFWSYAMPVLLQKKKQSQKHVIMCDQM